MNDLRSKSLMSLLREPVISYAAAASVPAANPAIVSSASAFGQGPKMASFVSVPVSNSLIITEDIHCGSLTYPHASVPDGNYVWSVADDVCTLAPSGGGSSVSYLNAWINSPSTTWNNGSVVVPFSTGVSSSADITVSPGSATFGITTAGTYQIFTSLSLGATGGGGTQTITTSFVVDGSSQQTLASFLPFAGYSSVSNSTIIVVAAPTTLSVSLQGTGGSGYVSSGVLNIVKI